MTLNRRAFIHRIGLALGAGVAGRGALELVLPDGVPGGLPVAEALTSTLPPGKPILVMIELAGGNDILNTIVPMNVAGTTGYYRTARPNLAITQVLGTRPYAAPAAGGTYLPPALDLDGAWALHGSLWWLANRWWTKGDVAIVQGAGENVAKEMSHFGAMAYRWAAAFTGPNLATGWLGRYNDVVAPGVPLGGVALATASQSLAGNSPAVVIGDISSFGWSLQNVPSGSQWLADFQAMGDRTLPTSLNKVAVAATALANANDAIAQVKGIAPPASGGGGQLGNQLATAAALILGGVPCQTYVAGFSGWDTHGGEPYNHFVQLQTLNDALARFFGIIDASSRANDVFVLITSEFGRQVSQNAGGGTDHGRASSNILVGGGVKGGLYGAFPDLAPAARSFDAMVPTVDFRSVFSTVLNRLGGDPNLTEAVLGRNESNASFGDLGVFTTGPTNPPPSTTTTVPGQTTTSTKKVDGTTTVPMSTTSMPTSSTTTTMPVSTTTTTTKVEPTTTTMATTTTMKPPSSTTTSSTTTTKPRRK